MTTPPPPDPPNMSRSGKWGVAPSAAPQPTRSQPGSRPALWWALAGLLGIVITVIVVVAVAG